MLRTTITLFMFFCFTSIASAEIYKWEDANGVHFSDNASSVPEKYREKVYAAAKEQTKTTPHVNAGIQQLNVPAVINQINQVAVYQSRLEQQRQTAEIVRQQQAGASAVINKNFENALRPLVSSIALWLFAGLFIFIIWVLTIVDIVRSEFESPSNKTVWMLLVILLPLLGMLLYYILGASQKVLDTSPESYVSKDQDELLARLRPRDPKEKDFII